MNSATGIRCEKRDGTNWRGFGGLALYSGCGFIGNINIALCVIACGDLMNETIQADSTKARQSATAVFGNRDKSDSTFTVSDSVRAIRMQIDSLRGEIKTREKEYYRILNSKPKLISLENHLDAIPRNVIFGIGIHMEDWQTPVGKNYSNSMLIVMNKMGDALARYAKAHQNHANIGDISYFSGFFSNINAVPTSGIICGVEIRKDRSGYVFNHLGEGSAEVRFAVDGNKFTVTSYKSL
jgi:hypothetical protein